MRIKFFLSLLLVVTIAYSQSDTIKGRVVDVNRSPIEYATIILHGSGRFKEVVYTDTTGCFEFNKVYDDNYQLIIQHILYNTDTINIGKNTKPENPIVLKEKVNMLREVSVTGERPQVRFEGNALVYDANLLTANKAILTAYEVVKEIPGIMETNNSLSLAGSEKLNIVINGQISTMTLDQVSTILKSMPVSNIQKIEIMYVPPSRYDVKGALINIILKNQSNTEAPVTGEARVSFQQSYYVSSNQNFNIAYNNKKLRVDVLGDVNSGKSWGKSNAYTIHELQENKIEISELTEHKNNYFDISSRIGVNYIFNTESNLTFSYYFRNNRHNSKSLANNIYNGIYNYEIFSINNNKNKNWLHNAYLQYAIKKLNIGIDYTLYKNPTDRHYTDEKNEVPNDDLINVSGQSIGKWLVHINHGVNLSTNINLNYGLNGGYNISNSNIKYLLKENDDHIENTNMRIESEQKEYTTVGFVDASYNINDKLSAFASIKYEYFKSNYNNNGIQKLLWENYTWYPAALITYNPNQRNRIQLSFSKDKRYPSFWVVNPQVTDVNSYIRIEGNPELKPNSIYRGQLLYVHDRKYTIIASMLYSPDYFNQIPHMSEDELKTIYRYENYDYMSRIGIACIVPIKIAKKFNTRVTLRGTRLHERMRNFYGSSFDNTSVNGSLSLNNSFVINKLLSFHVNGNYESPTRQGVSYLGERWILDFRIKWNFNKNAHLILHYDNILCHQMYRPMKIDYNNQYRWSRDFEKSSLGISLLWKFGSYVDKDYKSVDDARLGK
jgi:hypothetical protein